MKVELEDGQLDEREQDLAEVMGGCKSKLHFDLCMIIAKVKAATAAEGPNGMAVPRITAAFLSGSQSSGGHESIIATVK